jgi:hypothetical protein
MNAVFCMNLVRQSDALSLVKEHGGHQCALIHECMHMCAVQHNPIPQDDEPFKKIGDIQPPAVAQKTNK